jgi:hypothetical protein
MNVDMHCYYAKDTKWMQRAEDLPSKSECMRIYKYTLGYRKIHEESR